MKLNEQMDIENVVQDDGKIEEPKMTTKTKKKKPSKGKPVKKSAKASVASKYARANKPKKAAAAKGTQGQNGDPIELKLEKMNDDERKLLKAVYTPKGDRKPYSIKELQKFLGGGNTSPARNALRRLVRGGWFEKAERGQYKLTEKGRKRGIKD